MSARRGASEWEFAYALFESRGPVEWFDRIPAPSVGVNIVHKVAAADHEHTLVRHGASRLPTL
jgi:hypothetical protein